VHGLTGGGERTYQFGHRGEKLARVALSRELTAYVGARIAAFAEESPPTHLWLSRFVAQFGALPLSLGWFDTVGLKSDGEIIEWSTEDQYEGMRPVEDRYHWLSALVDGTRRYPELRAVLPNRPANAVDCRHLAHPLFAEGKVLCPECCGLGWVEAEGGRTSVEG